MANKTNIRDVGTSVLTGTIASIAVGGIGSYFAKKFGFDVDIVVAVLLVWSAKVGLPLLENSTSAIKNSLGVRSPTTVRASGSLARKIPINANGKTSHIFANVLPNFVGAVGSPTSNVSSEIIPSFVVSKNDISYEITSVELLDFLSTVWRRQMGHKNGLSRKFWLRQKHNIDCTKQQLPRLRYDALMACLLAVDGLVLDRGNGRSGRIALPPRAALDQISRVLH